MATPLYGLLLTGGKSSRMGKDKSQLTYHDQQPEWQRLQQLLGRHCDSVYLCHRADQDYASQPAIIDPGEGPLRAISCAQTAHPAAAWLVLACDLPLLSSSTIEHLIAQRDTHSDATCYASSIDSMPEPLCAIYEPAIAESIRQRIQSEQFDCPRGILKHANTKLITLPSADQHALMNTNSEADAIEVRAILADTRHSKPITLRYFAQHKDLTHLDQETISTESCTPSGLYEEIKSKYHFPHKQKHLMLAINGDFAPWHQLLQAGDEVIYLPPAAGG